MVVSYFGSFVPQIFSTSFPLTHTFCAFENCYVPFFFDYNFNGMGKWRTQQSQTFFPILNFHFIFLNKFIFFLFCHFLYVHIAGFILSAMIFQFLYFILDKISRMTSSSFDRFDSWFIPRFSFNCRMDLKILVFFKCSYPHISSKFTTFF